jgi:hypothetical protein
MKFYHKFKFKNCEGNRVLQQIQIDSSSYKVLITSAN